MRSLSCVVLLGLFAAPSARAEEAKKLNVLFIMSDDMRPDLGCYGNKLAHSPNLDRLASRSVRFDKAYVQYPLCNPSRSSMLNGRLPTTTGVLDNTTYFRDLHPDFITLPQLFKSLGYVTVRIGKIFHGGIDDADSWSEGGEAKVKCAAVQKKAAPKDRAQQSDRIIVLEGNGESHGDSKTAEKTIEMLRKHKGRPFFIACGFNKPHSPPTAPKRFFDLYDAAKIPLPKNFQPRPTIPAAFPKNSITPNGDLFIGRDASEQEAREMIRAYWASISFVDYNVGRVLEELERLGLAENTIVLFWGDHGYHLGEFGKWSKHGSLFELGTRVPLLVSMPGGKGNGKSTPRVVQAMDIYPTLCETCGLSAPRGLEGHSFKALLDNPDAAHEHPAFSVFQGGKKVHGRAVRTDRYRYVEYDGGQAGAMLFDHQNDRDELRNLADDPAAADVRRELAAVLRKRFNDRP